MDILKAIGKDISSLPKKLLKTYYKGGKLNATKLAVDLIPFLLLSYIGNKYFQAYEYCGDFIYAFTNFFKDKPVFFPKITSALPLLGGLACGVAFKLYMDARRKNAKKFRHGEEYGSAKWGTEADFAPYMDDNKWKNIPLTETEWLRMTRPEHPKYNRNYNIEVIGGSGSGKTRGFVKPSIMQMHSSYVVTDPKGTVLTEVGTMLKKGAYQFDEKGKLIVYKTGKNAGKPIRKPYKIKVFNTINFKKSMHYNPFVYIKTEQDVLKFVDTLVNNTKGEGNQSGEDFWVKAERLLYCAYVAYLVFHRPPEDRNFDMLLQMINASETKEDDEGYQNAIDLMFLDIENGNEDEGIVACPDSFAVSQYKKYKLAAGNATI